MGSEIPQYRLFRRPSDPRCGWSPTGRLGIRIERDGVEAAALIEIGWRTEDGAEGSLTLPELVGVCRSPDGEAWELRAEPLPAAPGDFADYLVFEGDNAQPLPRHPRNPLRLLFENGAGYPVRLSWRSADGEAGHAVFAPTAQDGHLAKVIEIQATAEHPENNEVASNLVDESTSTKWFAPVPRAELALRLGAERTVVRYDLTSADDAPDRDPRDWELLGACGHDWVVLDEREGQRFDTRLTPRTFTIADPRTCERYRLRILGNAGSPHLQVGGLRLHTAEGPQPPPGFLGWYRRPGAGVVPLRGFLIQRSRAPSNPRARASDAVPRSARHWRQWIASYSEQWTRTASADDLEHADLPPSALAGPPADNAAIEHTEARLGKRLPRSLRAFYAACDGLREAGSFGERVLPLAELGWMRDTESELLGILGGADAKDTLSALLRRALRVGLGDDGDHWFLDPADRSDGDWAAYTWHPSDGSEPERYDSFAAMLVDERAILEQLRAGEGRPARPKGADNLLAEGRRLALSGEVTAAHEMLNRAIDAGSALAAYLDAQVRLFAYPLGWHEATLRNGVLGNDHVMAAIADDHLRGDLVPMYLALTQPDDPHPTGAFARRLCRFVSRIDALPNRPAADGEQYDAAWEAFAATLVTAAPPDPGPFGRACDIARELIDLGRPDEAWHVLLPALRSWKPDSVLRVMPIVLITDPVLRTIMTQERRLIAAVARETW